MSTIFSLFIFFLCVSMHGYSARHVGVINNESAATQPHFCGKGCDKVKEVDLKKASVRGRNGDGSIINKSNEGSAITHQQQKEDTKAALLLLLSGHVSVSWHVPVKNNNNNHNHASKPPGFFSDYSQPRTRSEIFESSSYVGLLKGTSFLEGSRRRAIEMNNNKAAEDVAAATDYEPPHQTPPIHNSQP